MAKVVVLAFDQYQVLRMKSLWTPERLEKITHQYPHKEYHLHHQFRMTASDQLSIIGDELRQLRQYQYFAVSYLTG